MTYNNRRYNFGVFFLLLFLNKLMSATITANENDLFFFSNTDNKKKKKSHMK